MYFRRRIKFNGFNGLNFIYKGTGNSTILLSMEFKHVFMKMLYTSNHLRQMPLLDNLFMNQETITTSELELVNDLGFMMNVLERELKLTWKIYQVGIEDISQNIEYNYDLFKLITKGIRIKQRITIDEKLSHRFYILFKQLFLLLRKSKVKDNTYRLYYLIEDLILKKNDILVINNQIKMDLLASVMNRLINVEENADLCLKLYNLSLENGYKLTPFMLNYAIQSHLKLDNNKEAHNIYEIVKQRRIIPSIHTFNIFLRDCSVKKSFKDFKYWWLQLQKQNIRYDSYTRCSIIYNLAIHKKYVICSTLFNHYINKREVDDKERLILATIMIDTAATVEEGLEYFKLACQDKTEFLEKDDKILYSMLKLLIKFQKFESGMELFRHLLTYDKLNSKHIYQMISLYSIQNKLFEAKKLLYLPKIGAKDKLFLNYKLCKEFSNRFSTSDLFNFIESNNYNIINKNMHKSFYHTVLKTLLYRIESHQPINKKSKDHMRQMEYYYSILIERMVSVGLLSSTNTKDLDIRTATLLIKAYLFLNEYDKANKLIKPFIVDIDNEAYNNLTFISGLKGKKKNPLPSTSKILYDFIENRIPKLSPILPKTVKQEPQPIAVPDVYILEMKLQILIHFKRYKRVFLMYKLYRDSAGIRYNSLDFLLHSLFAIHSLDFQKISFEDKEKEIINVLKRIDRLYLNDKSFILKRVNLFYGHDDHFKNLYF